jgi:hypothetical protein
MGTGTTVTHARAQAPQVGQLPQAGPVVPVAPTGAAASDGVPDVAGGTPAQQQVVDQGIALIQQSPTGRAALRAAERYGVRIEITTDTDFADYNKDVGPNGTVRINPKVLTSPSRLAGVLAHETGHSLVHHQGVFGRLQKLPDNTGTLANEVVAEALSSAIAREAGFPRGESAITRADGSLRAPAQGFDNILTSQFYLDHYRIDPSKLSAADYRKAYDTITTESNNLIASLGGTPPHEYTAHATRIPSIFGRPPQYHWHGPKESQPVDGGAAHVPATPAKPPHGQLPAPKLTPEQLEALRKAFADAMAAMHHDQQPAAPTPRSGPS